MNNTIENMTDWKQNFLRYLQNIKNFSSHTLRNYDLDLVNFYTFLDSQHIYEVDKKKIRLYLAYLNQKNLSKRTVLRRLSTLRSFFKFLFKEKLIPNNPLEGISSPKLGKTLPLALTREEIDRFFEQPDVGTFLGFRDRVIMELFYSSGLRVSELIHLNRSDFNDKQFLLKVKGKGKKERLIPVTKNAAQWIIQYLQHPSRYLDGEHHQKEKDQEAIFLNKWGTRLTSRSVDRNFKFYLKKSGLATHITPHIIRHTIATHWLENGMDLKVIQSLLGHDSLFATTVYTHLSSATHKKIYKKTHPLAKKTQLIK